METSFAELLRRLIEGGRFESRRHFARVAEGADREESAQAYLAKVINEHSPPIIERAEAWADALELYGDERQQFLDLAAIAHLPTSVQPRFIALLRQFVTLKSDLKARDESIKVLQAAVEERNAFVHGMKVRLDAIETQGNRVRKDV